MRKYYSILSILITGCFISFNMLIAQETTPNGSEGSFADSNMSEVQVMNTPDRRINSSDTSIVDTFQTPVRRTKSNPERKNPPERKILLVRKGKLRQFYILQPNQIFEMRVEKPEYISITIDPNGNQVISIPEDIESTIYYTGLSITDTAQSEDDLGFEDKELDISFSNKDRYLGMLKNGLPHGKGKIIFNNGDVYEGEFEKGNFHGKGTYFDLDGGTTYLGDFKEGVRQGYGKLYRGPVGDSIIIYQGEYLNDLFHGKGKYYNNQRLRYTGEFSEGEFAGMGKLYENSKLIYEGQFIGGAMHGEGVKYASQGIYEGMFKEDQFHGLGVFRYENGDTLSGTFSEGEIYYGEFTYANGDTYKGELLKGIKHGKGFYTNNEGDTYYGTFRDGALVDGTCLFNDGSKYEGELENWRFDGQGKYFFPDGSYVTGIFKEGKFCEGYEYKMKKNGKLKKKKRKIENC